MQTFMTCKLLILCNKIALAFKISVQCGNWKKNRSQTSDHYLRRKRANVHAEKRKALDEEYQQSVKDYLKGKANKVLYTIHYILYSNPAFIYLAS